MKKLKKIKEEFAMSATGVSGGGPIAGLPPDPPPVGAGVVTGKSLLRRRRPATFAGNAVFKVNSDAFHKAKLGKKKFEHYSSYVGRDEVGDDIRSYIKENPNAPVILEDELTGAMVYLKYGKR